MSNKIITPFQMAQFTDGLQDVVSGATRIPGVSTRPVAVASESDLDTLTDYPIGTFAYLIGMKAMWQKKSDDEWEPVFDRRNE